MGAIPIVRYACMADLNNYFKKSDLLSGLTSLERGQLRTNIGILDYVGEGGQSTPLEITYPALYDLITRNTLVVGARYIIPDFQTIYASNTVNTSMQRISWGTTESANPSKSYSLVAIANTTNTLDPRVTLLDPLTKNWIVEYDITKETLQDGVTTKGKITYLRDDNGNSAYYDFKNIKFRRNQEDLIGTTFPIETPFIDLYTFSDISNNVVLDSSNLDTIKFNVMQASCWNNIFMGDTYNNIIESGCQNNTFLRGCHDSTIKWESVNNLFNEMVAYLSGSIYNKTIAPGDTSLAMTITKTVQKVNEATIVSYLDPITYAYQIIIL